MSDSTVFGRGAQDFSITDRDRQQTYTDGLTVNARNRELLFSDFGRLPEGVYYWNLPEKYLGNKVGHLTGLFVVTCSVGVEL